MSGEHQNQQRYPNTPDDIDQFEDIQISDEELEQIDKHTAKDARAAKKRARLVRTAEEKKRLKRNKMLIAISTALCIVAVLGAVPTTRWPLLNFLGLRGSLLLTVQEESLHIPLAEAEVIIDGQAMGSTNNLGTFYASELRLGVQKIEVKKPGYSEISRSITISPRTNTYEAPLQAIGVKVNVGVKDWLTGRPIKNARVSQDKNTSRSDAKGQAVLVVPPPANSRSINIKADGYLEREIKVEEGVISKEVTLVSSAKNYFISKRDGKFDIFSSHLDGSGQKKIISGTGKEESHLLQFTIHRNNKRAILVATRESKRQGGRIVAGVYEVNLQKAALTKIDEGSDTRIIGWAGDTLFYAKTQPGVQYDAKNASRIMAYNAKTSLLTQVAEANYFQLAEVAGGALLYAPADAYRERSSSSLTSFTAATGARQTYLKNKPANYGLQTAYGVMRIELLDGGLYDVNTQTGTVTPVDSRTENGRVYALSQDGSSIASIERRDGKGALILSSVQSSRERIVAKIPGMVSPLRWVSERHIVVRVATNQETADFIVDVPTGAFSKIVDVSNVEASAQNQL